MSVKKPKITKTEVSQKINLKKAFGIDFKEHRGLKEIIGQAILDKMLDRVDKGIGMSFVGDNGRPFNLNRVKSKNPAKGSSYSKDYVDSPEFKAFGKKKTPVNMRLTGDMLETMDFFDESANQIKIGWDDDTENKKAFNHSTGDTVPRRPFFGINNRELNEIKKDLQPEIKKALRLKKDEGRKAFESFILSLLDEVKKSGDES